MAPSTIADRSANRTWSESNAASPAQIPRSAPIVSRRCWRRSAVSPNGLPIMSCSAAKREPGAALQTDDEILGWIRERATTIYHPTSTCAMGKDAGAVVDERLRLHGITGLRVADASIMPTIVSGNTNAPAIMIGEKCAAMVREDASTRIAA